MVPASVAPPPPPVLPVPPRTDELPRYPLDSRPLADATHVDSDIQSRARSMHLPERPDSEPPTLVELERPIRDDAAYDPSATSALWQRDPLPGFGAAMRVRVRFVGAEVPLWSLVAPLVILALLTAALAATAVGNAREAALSGATPLVAPPASVIDGVSQLAALPGSVASPAASLAAPSLPARLPAATGANEADTAAGAAADFNLLPEPYAAAQVFAVAEARRAREVGLATKLAAALDRDPGLIQEATTLAELRRMSDNPETARTVLQAMAALPAPLAADLLYAIWTGTVQRNETTELARVLLHSQDVRPKASPALAVALDLRQAETCEANAAILPRAAEHADRRSLHLLTKLQRRYGCGPNKRLDCYPCLRKGSELEAIVAAVKGRREPRTFGRR